MKKTARAQKSSMTARVQGKRFSRVNVTTAHNESGTRVHIERMALNTDMNFEDHVARVKDECAAILRQSGLPTAPRLFKRLGARRLTCNPQHFSAPCHASHYILT
jgi:hypothetical protein